MPISQPPDLPEQNHYFKNLLRWTVIVPVVALAILAASLLWGIQYLRSSSQWVDHTDRVIGESQELLKLVIDMESGVRGYLASGSDEFLQPYNEAEAVVDSRFDDLNQLVADSPSQQARLANVRRIFDQWHTAAVRAIDQRRSGANFEYETKLQQKQRMDSLREGHRAFVAAEERLRNERVHTSQRAARLLLINCALLSLVIGGFLAVFTRHQMHLLGAQFQEALDVRNLADEEIQKLNTELEQRVLERTAELTASNKELEAFSYSVSHDLRAPLRHIDGYSRMLLERYSAHLDAKGQHYLEEVRLGAQKMAQLVDELLALSRVGRQELQLQVTGLNSLFEEARTELMKDTGDRHLEWKIAALPFIACDPTLMRQVVTNLLSNAVKYSRPRERTVIEVGQTQLGNDTVVFVRDNGVGFDMKYADKLFGVFQRLHRTEEFEGTGVGLAMVQRIIGKHNGRVWAKAELDKGATFFFTVRPRQSETLNRIVRATGESHARDTDFAC